MDLLDEIIETLSSGKQLPVKNNDHALQGKYKGLRECHVAPDWLLVYYIDKGVLVLTLFRTGSHCDLF
jgi:mRNA interferase YafQ